jgi:hypothetical protein
MFADYSNHQIERYVSWKPDPKSAAVDAFAQDWRKWGNVYVFPPFGLVARVLHLVCTQRVEVTLVFPYWPTQPWFPVLQEMMLGTEYIIPQHESMLLDVQANKHPLMRESTLRVGVCRISGKR